ncbi:MAG TPA: permease-like cell division protein FtsX [Burkholderiales bacterium]|nr:permease-like cell division protein FtsX [Burkholderiales bacterium]
MSTWLRHHRQALASAFRRLSVLNALVIGIALALPAGGYALLSSLRPAGERLALEPRISLFLQPQAPRSHAEALGRTLRGDPRISAVRFVPREEALKELSAVQGLSEVIAALGRNPLPDAFVVTSNADIAGELARLPGVAHVQSDAVWARRMAAAARLTGRALTLLAALLGAGLVAVTFNTIRLQILTRRDEMEVSKLLGATDAFIRRPFYYLGLLQGLAGGALALALVAAALAVLNREVVALADSYGSAFRFSFLPVEEALALVLLAGVLGLLGAQLSMSRHLRAIEPR